MNAKQGINLTMQMAVRDCLINNATITATIPGFAAFFTPFSGNITLIENISEQQGFNRKGITGNKKQLKATLIALAKDTVSEVEAYAVNTNNTVLASEVHATESSLKSMAALKLRDKCQQIYDRAASNISALATYHITAATQTALQGAITNYNTAIPKVKLSASEKKQLTSQLKGLFKANEGLLKSIDTLIETIRVSQPVFYGTYKNSRKLTATGIHKLVLKVKVVDSVDGKTIKNVAFKFVQVNSDDQKTIMPDVKPIVRKTAVSGGFRAKQLDEGVYNVTVTKKGYKTQSIIINITHGETAKVDVMMEKN